MVERRSVGLSPRSIDRYSRELGDWFLWRRARGLPDEVGAITADEIRSYLDYLRSDRVVERGDRRGARGLRSWTIAGIDKVLRIFLRYLANEGQLEDRTVRLILRRVRSQRITMEPRQTYTPDIIRALLDGCDTTTEKGARDCAIILLLCDSGMRVAELCGMQETRTDYARRYAQILGKGGRWRHVSWGAETAAALQRYCQLRRGSTADVVFRGVNSTNDGQQLTPGAIRRMLKKLAARVGVELAAGSPAHSFRHTFAIQALDAGLDGLVVQQLLGHRDIRTTMIYTQMRPERLRVYHQRVSGWWDRDTSEGSDATHDKEPPSGL